MWLVYEYYIHDDFTGRPPKIYGIYSTKEKAIETLTKGRKEKEVKSMLDQLQSKGKCKTYISKCVIKELELDSDLIIEDNKYKKDEK